MAVASDEGLRSSETGQLGGKSAELEGSSGASDQASRGSIRVPFWLRLALSLGVLGYLLWRTDLGQLRAIFSSVIPLGLAAAIGAQLVGKVVWSYRWSALLKAFDLQISIWRLMRAIYIGQFFNNFLPTSVGGDLYRGYWVLDNPEGYPRSMFIIFLERFIGLVTMGFIALPALALLVVQSGQHLEGELLAIALLLVLLCGGVLALQPSFFQLVERILNRLAIPWFAGLRANIREGLKSLQSAGNLRWWIILASVGVQLVGIGFYYALGEAVGLDLAAWHYLVMVPLVSLATMLPISINGMGVREGSLILITRALGVDVTLDEALALGLLASMLIPAVSLLGGWFYIRGRNENVRRLRFPTNR